MYQGFNKSIYDSLAKAQRLELPRLHLSDLQVQSITIIGRVVPQSARATAIRIIRRLLSIILPCMNHDI